MRYRCNVCNIVFHDCDQDRSEQRNGQCPSCQYEDIQEIVPKVCPVLSASDKMVYCIHESCASWNDYFQKCVMAIPAHLNAQEEQRIKSEEAQTKAYAEGCARRF